MHFWLRTRFRALALFLAVLLSSVGITTIVGVSPAYAANCGDVLVSGSDWAGGEGVVR